MTKQQLRNYLQQTPENFNSNVFDTFLEQYYYHGEHTPEEIIASYEEELEERLF